MSQSVADFVLSRLPDSGVRRVFGFAGDGIDGLPAARGQADNDAQLVQSHGELVVLWEEKENML
jgi:pyruvate dehydrogenase (quinone)